MNVSTAKVVKGEVRQMVVRTEKNLNIEKVEEIVFDEIQAIVLKAKEDGRKTFSKYEISCLESFFNMLDIAKNFTEEQTKIF